MPLNAVLARCSSVVAQHPNLPSILFGWVIVATYLTGDFVFTSASSLGAVDVVGGPVAPITTNQV
jgi:hypothetical protein